MKRFVTWLVVLAVIAGLAWWQRETVVPFVTARVPAAVPYLAKVPGLAEIASGKAQERSAGQSEAQGGRGSRRGGGGGGPVPVVLAKVETKSLPVTMRAVGRVEASASVAIRPRVDSQILTVDVAEGAKVKEGDQLFSLDDRAPRAQLAQIEAQIVRTRAQIEQAENDVKRANDLLKRNAGNVVTRDIAATALKVAQAQLEADKASREAMETTLSYAVIRAPFSGRIGSIPIKPGAIVRSGDSAAIATLNRVDPAMVAFAIPQARLGELRRAMAKGPVRVDVTEGEDTLSGKVAFIENAIDVATGTVTVKAEVANEAEILWPGAFVTVTLFFDAGEPSVAIPGAAVQLGQDGAYVFVVRDGKSELRPVNVSRNAGQDAVIGKGVEPGEEVVVEGQLRLVDGASVTVKPRTALDEPVTTTGKS
jgi:membrane fusion protein, multidrug efflux system